MRGVRRLSLPDDRGGGTTIQGAIRRLTSRGDTGFSARRPCLARERGDIAWDPRFARFVAHPLRTVRPRPDIMAKNDEDQPLTKRAGGADTLTYAKWGLMGVGALVIIGWVLSHWLWVLAAGGVGFLGYSWMKSSKGSGGGTSDAAPPPPRSSSAAAPSSQTPLDDFERRMRELDELSKK